MAAAIELRRLDGIAYREALPEDWSGSGPNALLVHGWPESSYMWRELLFELAQRGVRAVAPDLPGFGDSDADPPGTWERHTETLERFRVAAGLERPALIVHDWGVMIGLRWACDHPGTASSLVISDGGFFADRRWHDLANLLRTPEEGEKFIDTFGREQFDAALRAASDAFTDAALDEYWKAFSDPVRRAGTLELYRSGDFDKLEPYEGRLRALKLPALIVWGGQDRFATPRFAERFRAELDDAEVLVFDAAGHFVWEDEPQATSRAAAEFVARTAAV